MKEFIIGIDAGGTKTRACAYETGSFSLLGEAISGPGNLANHTGNACREISGAVQELLDAIPGQCVFLAVGAAGISAVSDGASAADQLESCLKQLPGLAPVPMELIPDAELSLYANFDPAPDTTSAIVISGTGSAVFAFAGEHIIRSGGWGNILGDGGSGYHVGILFLKKLTEYADTDARLHLHALHLLEETGCTALTVDNFRSAIVDLVYRQPKSAVAALAPYIAQLAETWDPARQILHESANALVTDVAHLFDRAPASVKNLAYTGGFLTNCAPFRQIFLEKLHQRIPDVTILEASDPTLGAIRLFRQYRRQL